MSHGSAAVPLLSSGSTLFEVLVALALLGGALLSGVGLLSAGNRQVDGGGQRSQALAVAQAILEELRAAPFDALPSHLGCDRSAPSCGVATGEARAAAWQALADASSLPAARVEVELAPVGATSLAEAPVLRLRVRVRWGRGPRPRAVLLSLVRV